MKWSIEKLAVLDIGEMKDVVIGVGFSVFDEQAGISAVISSGATLPAPDPQNFKPFPELKETDVEGWAKLSLGAEGIQKIEDSVQRLIDQQQIPQPKEKPLPWKGVTP